MEASVAQLLKRQYRNNTAGWLGVVILDHKGEEQGVNIEPYGTRWLSDAEAILTARAPRRPEDNPFEEQMFVMQDSNGTRQEVAMRPLELVSAGSSMPAEERYVPHLVDDATGRVLADAASRGDEDGPMVMTNGSVAARMAEIVEGGPAQRTVPGDVVAGTTATPQTSGSQAPGGSPAPPVTAAPSGPVPPVRQEPAPQPASPTGLSGAAGAPAGTAGDEAAVQSWDTGPEAPGVVLRGSLGGDNTPPPAATAAAAPDPTLPAAGDGPGVAPQAPAPPAAPQAGTEEHAAAVDPSIGEETGAARPPVAAQPEGEFAQAEEVGSPDAPAANDNEGLIGA
jgi:hypothetical protein